MGSAFPSLTPFEEGGALFLFGSNESSWELLNVIETGGGLTGAVFDVAMSNDGLTTAFVAGTNSTVDSLIFVSVYSLSSNGLFQQIGNSLIEDYFDATTTVGLVEERLFVSSADGFIRVYDLNVTWKQIGTPLAHFDSAMFLPSQEKSIVVTASPFFDIQVFEYQNATWKTLDATILNGFVSNHDIAAVNVWRDGTQILVTESVPDTATGPHYTAKRFYRGIDNVYYLSSETELFHDGILGATQFMDEGSMSFILDAEVAVYQQVPCG